MPESKRIRGVFWSFPGEVPSDYITLWQSGQIERYPRAYATRDIEQRLEVFAPSTMHLGDVATALTLELGYYNMRLGPRQSRS